MCAAASQEHNPPAVDDTARKKARQMSAEEGSFCRVPEEVVKTGKDGKEWEVGPTEAVLIYKISRIHLKQI
jgi:hypothetical protein